MAGAPTPLSDPATLPDDIGMPDPAPMPAPDLAAPAPFFSQPSKELGLDLFLGDLPGDARSPLEPLEPGATAPAPAAGLGLDLSIDLPGHRAPAPLDLLDVPVAAAPREAKARGPAAPRGPAASTSGAGLGFSLDLDGTAGAAPSAPLAPGVAVPHPLPAFPRAAAGSGSGMPTLAPPRKVESTKKVKGPTLRAGFLLKAGGGAAAAAVVFVVFFSFVLPWLRSGPGVAKVLEAFTTDLDRDHYQAYGRAAEQLAGAAADRPHAIDLRAAAAEQWLMSVLVRGAEKAKQARAEQILAGIEPDSKPTAQVNRARALLAIASGKTREVDAALGADVASPASFVVVGLQQLAEGKNEPAVTTFRRALAAFPSRMAYQYLLARALEESGKVEEAAGAYKQVLARNSSHAGARIGVARLASDSPAQVIIDEAQAVMDKGGGTASPGEMAQASLVLGSAKLALGRSAEAIAAFGQALAVNPQNVAASLALGSALLFDNRFAEALARFRLAGAAALKKAEGKFGMGGALIATGLAKEGASLIHQAAQESPNDPRGPFWQGWLAEAKSPADLEAANFNYRAALAKDRKFLPAALRLAAILQRGGKPQDSLAVLRDAETAGVPATLLQLAWGEALIGAGEPARAEEVFRKALAQDEKLGPAHLGLAASLDAQGKTQDAQKELQQTLGALPDLAGVRERLALLALKLGQKPEALSYYRAALATGKAEPRVRVDAAGLALDIGRVDIAKEEAEKAVADDPSTPDALFTLARLREAEGNLGQAIQEYRHALKFGSAPELHLALGRALLKANKEEEGMAELDGAASLPGARIERGRVLFRKGDPTRALEDFEAAARLAPTNAEALLLQGLCHDQMGKNDLAAAAWRTALKVEPDLSEAHFRLGRMEMDRGHASAALPYLRRAVVKVPEKAGWETEAYFQLGYAETSAGSRGNAATALKKYLQLAPADAPARPEVERQLDRLGHR